MEEKQMISIEDVNKFKKSTSKVDLITILTNGAYTQKEISEKFGITQAGANIKLNTMLREGICIRDKVGGIWHYYIPSKTDL